MLRPYMLGLLAESSLHTGHVEEGLAVVAEALMLAGTADEAHHLAQLYRAQGELLLAQASTPTNGSMPYDIQPCSLISRIFGILPYPMSENERFMHCFAQEGSV